MSTSCSAKLFFEEEQNCLKFDRNVSNHTVSEGFIQINIKFPFSKQKTCKNHSGSNHLSCKPADPWLHKSVG